MNFENLLATAHIGQANCHLTVKTTRTQQRRIEHIGTVSSSNNDLEGCIFLQGDFREEAVLQQLLATLDQRPVDIILSDMAPNTSGIPAVDVPRSIYLSELALEFAGLVLKPGGDLLIKVFQGSGFDAFLKDVRSVFTKVQLKKPKASRDRSVEVYVLARGYRGKQS